MQHEARARVSRARCRWQLPPAFAHWQVWEARHQPGVRKAHDATDTAASPAATDTAATDTAASPAAGRAATDTAATDTASGRAAVNVADVCVVHTG